MVTPKKRFALSVWAVLCSELSVWAPWQHPGKSRSLRALQAGEMPGLVVWGGSQGFWVLLWFCGHPNTPDVTAGELS